MSIPINITQGYNNEYRIVGTIDVIKDYENNKIKLHIVADETIKYQGEPFVIGGTYTPNIKYYTENQNIDDVYNVWNSLVESYNTQLNASSITIPEQTYNSDYTYHHDYTYTLTPFKDGSLHLRTSSLKYGMSCSYGIIFNFLFAGSNDITTYSYITPGSVYENISNNYKLINNIWKLGVIWKKISGIWKRGCLWKKINGIWKKGV